MTTIVMLASLRENGPCTVTASLGVNAPFPNSTAPGRSPERIQVPSRKELDTSLKRKRRPDRPSLALQACGTANRACDWESMNFDLSL